MKTKDVRQSGSGKKNSRFLIGLVSGITLVLFFTLVGVATAQLIPTIVVMGDPLFGVYGQPVTITATVVPISQHGPISGTPTGTIHFNYGEGQVTVPLSGGSATITASGFLYDAYNIEADYSGDNTYQASSGTTELFIYPAATSISLTSSANPSGYGQPVTFTAQVTSGPSRGELDFMIDGAVVSDQDISGGLATYTTSSLSTGSHAVSVFYSPWDENYGTAGAQLSQVILPVPSVTGVSPNQGVSWDPPNVTISGSGFTGATAVNFGSVQAVSFSVLSDTQIEAEPNAAWSSPWTVDVTVTTPAGTSATSPADQFTFTNPTPVVTSISPNKGPASGGTQVTVTGSGFSGAGGVCFGSAYASGSACGGNFVIDSDTQITATSPPGTGTVWVTVYSPVGTSATSPANQFTYVNSSPSVHITTTTGIPITVSSSGETTLSNVKAMSNPSPVNSPANVSWPLGLISFDLGNVPVGGTATVTITMPAGTKVDTYYKFGPTPDNATAHWYPFMFDGQTGAVIRGNVITLHFVDGKRGDDDIAANGVISDVGGPGYMSNIKLAPEFPSVLLPAGLVIGFLGIVFFVRRNEEK